MLRAKTKTARVVAIGMALGSILLSAPAAESAAATEVRFLHAVPGAEQAELRVTGAGSSEPVRFGEATEYLKSSAGSVKATVVAGGTRLGTATEVPEEGRHTIVLRGSGENLETTLVKDGEAAPSRSRWRIVHAAPEIDEAEFVLDDRVVGRLEAGSDTGYETVEPGTYSLTARRPGDKDAMVKSPTVDLVAGTAQTAYLVGSGGEPTRFVVLQDAASAPEVAPATGLGGLGSGGGQSWLLALLAAAVAGVAGGLAYSRQARG